VLADCQSEGKAAMQRAAIIDADQNALETYGLTGPTTGINWNGGGAGN
jgi:hypothetical protein